MQQYYEKHAASAAILWFYIFQKGACPPKDAEEEIGLTDETNRKALVDEIIDLIVVNDLIEAAEDQKTKFFLELALKDASPDGGNNQLQSNAALLLFNMNMIDLITRHYYKLFPKYKPMFEMINQMAESCPQGLSVVFGDDLPIEVRRVCPHLSSLFEQSRASY